MNSSYFIYKCVSPTGGDPCYWDDSIGKWTPEFSEATSFPIMILTTPLPPGATHVIETNTEGEPLGTYTFIKSSNPPIYEKSY